MNATERLDAIEARANAATEGPWDTSHDRPTATRPVWAYDVRDSGGDEVMVNGFHSDTVFIAHARQDVPALVTALRAVERECASVDASASRGVKVHVGVLYLRDQVRAAIETALGGPR